MQKNTRAGNHLIYSQLAVHVGNHIGFSISTHYKLLLNPPCFSSGAGLAPLRQQQITVTHSNPMRTAATSAPPTPAAIAIMSVLLSSSSSPGATKQSAPSDY